MATHAQALAYFDRLKASYGYTLPDRGVQDISDLLAWADAQGFTIEGAYLGGTDHNVPADRQAVAALVGTDDLAQDAGAGSVLNVGQGIFQLDSSGPITDGRVEGTQQFVTNTPSTYFTLLQGAPIKDYGDVAVGTQILWNQQDAVSTGAWSIVDDGNGQQRSSYISASDPNVVFRGASTSPSLAVIDPRWLCWTYEPVSRNVVQYDAFDTDTILDDKGGFSTTMPAGGFAGDPLRFGGASIAGGNGGATCGIVKIASVLDSAQRATAAAYLFDWFRRRCPLVIYYGTSITDDADAAFETQKGDGSVHLVIRDLLGRGALGVRPRNMDGRNRWAYRAASGFTLDPDTATRIGALPPRWADAACDTWAPWKPTVVCYDDGTNDTRWNDGGTGATKETKDFSDVSDHIEGVFTAALGDLANYTSIKVAGGTGMCWRGDHTESAEDVGSMLVWNDYMRTRDAVAEHYAAVNLAPDPVNDPPDGDPAKFFDDPIHPNTAEHAQRAIRTSAAVVLLITPPPEVAPTPVRSIGSRAELPPMELGLRGDVSSGLADAIRFSGDTVTIDGRQRACILEPEQSGHELGDGVHKQLRSGQFHILMEGLPREPVLGMPIHVNGVKCVVDETADYFGVGMTIRYSGGAK